MSEIIGKLDFHSETGTEGGYFALQNSEFIEHVLPDFGVFTGSKVYDPEDLFRKGKVLKSYRDDGSDFRSARKGDVSNLDIEWDDQILDMARKSDSVLVERWSYEGLEYINDGDKLIVLSKGIGSSAIWAGTVEIERQDPYHEDSYSAFGLASHYRPMLKNVDADTWAGWFFDEKYAILERAK